MSGYYDWSPSVALERPVVLTGFLGARVGRVANVLSGITGHRLVDVARGVEHRAGQSLGALRVSGGLEAIEAHQAAVVDQALRIPPPPLIALGHRMLLDRTLRTRIASEAVMVYVKVSLDTAVQRVRSDIGENGANHYAWFDGVVPDHDDLRHRFLPLRPGYESADHVVDGDDNPSAVAAAIVQVLGL